MKAPAATLGLLLAGACARETPSQPDGMRPALTRLLTAGSWRNGGVALAASQIEPAVICGAERPAWIVEDGATLECDVALPRVPSWLDVEAAALPIDGERGPPPAARLTVRVRVGGSETTLYDGIPSAGTPPTAFGFGAARVDLAAGPLTSGAPATFLFRVESVDGSRPRKVALAAPRLSPRALAADRPRLRVELHARAPDPAALAASVAKERWPAFLALVEEGATWEARPAAAGAAPPAPQEPHEDLEVAGFGPLAELAPAAKARRFDSCERCDPWRFAADDPLVVAHAGWDEALLRDRFRALGEHRLFRELARPRRTALAVVIATRVEGAELDAALGRLIAHLRANELWDGTELVVTPLGGEGASPSGPWLRRPRRSR